MPSRWALMWGLLNLWDAAWGSAPSAAAGAAAVAMTLLAMWGSDKVLHLEGTNT